MVRGVEGDVSMEGKRVHIEEANHIVYRVGDKKKQLG